MNAPSCCWGLGDHGVTISQPPKQTPCRWCFAWFAASPPRTTEDKLGLLKSSKWQSVDVIRVTFLDGTTHQRALVKRFAPGWTTNLARLAFSWVSDPADSDVRISFSREGSWSVIGSTCKEVPKGQPTMNFGWLAPDIADADARGVILHEFGHALGLVHEHQRLDPSGWNKEAVKADLSQWDDATIEHNLFEPMPSEAIDGSTLDTTSIMMYEVPAHWRTDGYSAGFNTELSPTDKTFICKLYP